MKPVVLVILITLLALVPVVEPVWATGLHSTGHGYCPVHANPGILAEPARALPLPRAWNLGGAGDSIHLLALTRLHFVPPRP